MSPSALSERALGGDAQALAQLLQESEPDLRRFAARLCRSGADADDAVQHAMLKVTLGLGRFRGIARFSTWAFTVIRRECQKYEKRARRWLFQETDLVESREPTPEEALGRQRTLQVVIRALREMRPDLREIFVLRELDGLSTESAARALGITETNAKVRLNRARSALRAALLAAEEVSLDR